MKQQKRSVSEIAQDLCEAVKHYNRCTSGSVGKRNAARKMQSLDAELQNAREKPIYTRKDVDL